MIVVNLVIVSRLLGCRWGDESKRGWGSRQIYKILARSIILAQSICQSLFPVRRVGIPPFSTHGAISMHIMFIIFHYVHDSVCVSLMNWSNAYAGHEVQYEMME